MAKNFIVMIEKAGKYYTASVADLPCCYAKARTLEKLVINTRKAVKRYLKEEDDIPKANFVGVRMLELRGRQKKRFTVAIERDSKLNNSILHPAGLCRAVWW